jgi:hypothetical protein
MEWTHKKSHHPDSSFHFDRFAEACKFLPSHKINPRVNNIQYKKACPFAIGQAADFSV